MKKFLSIFLLLFAGNVVFAFYDFCESPADYNTFPQAYDVRTEYWKDIPNYHPQNIEYKNIDNQNPTSPFHIRKSKKQETEKSKIIDK